jgi:hypothetical protein
MYGGIAAAIVVAEVGATARRLVSWTPEVGATPSDFLAHAIAVLTLAGMVYRYFDVHERFCDTIVAFEQESEAHQTSRVSVD